MKKLQIRIVIFLLALTSIPDMRAMSSEEMHALLRDLSSDVGGRVEAARLELEKYSDTSAVVLAETLLESTSLTPETRQLYDAIVKAFNILGSKAKNAVPTLINALESENPFVVSTAIESLAAIGPEAAEAIPALTEQFKKPGWFDKAAASLTVAAILNDIQSAKERLDGQLRSSNPHIRIGSAFTLLLLETQEIFAMDTLMELLKEDDVSVRFSAVMAIGFIADKHHKALERLRPGGRSLRELFGDESPLVRKYASHAMASLGAIGIPEIRSALQSENSQVRYYALRALALMGEAAKLAKDDLTALRDDPDPRVKLEVNRLLESLVSQ
jgi:HEAT repeat protein